MKRCLKCNELYEFLQNICPQCGNKARIVDGFTSYSPKLDGLGSGFKPEYFANLAKHENSNFWFQIRNRLILWTIENKCPKFKSFLEIGCGTGYVLSAIAETYPQWKIFGSEIFTAGLKFATEKLPLIHFFQMDARDIPFFEEFDAIGAFDILEHIEEDEKVLSQIFNALTSNGHLLVTVPQHEWLWTYVDEYSLHFRRYSSNELHLKILRAGFEIIFSTSFMAILLPAMVLSRLKMKIFNLDPISELQLSPLLNSFLYKLSSIDHALIKSGISLPIGVSRLVVARKS